MVCLVHSVTLGERLSDIFPLHNDKKHALPWLLQRRIAKPETFRTERIGGARRDRTDDLKLAKLPLSQLSYGPAIRRCGRSANELVGLGGFEPPTSRLSSARSNQLSYRPNEKEVFRRPKTSKAFARMLERRRQAQC